MNKKLRRVIAIIALVSMALFSVSFILYLADNAMLNGGMGAFALFFGGLGIALFVVLKLSRDNTDQIVEDATDNGEGEQEKTEETDKTEQPEGETEENTEESAENN